MKYKTDPQSQDTRGAFIDFPERLRMARKRLGETQTEFGRRFGVSDTAICYWETNQRQMPYDAIWLILMELDMLKEDAV